MPDALTPEWWRDRLAGRLVYRWPFIQSLDEWYAGPQPAPAGYRKARALLTRLHEAANTNVCALVTDAAVELMHVEGFKIDGKIDDDAWAIWQSNAMDLGVEQMLLESSALSEASLLVSPETNADGLPTITPEHPSQTIVEYEPGRLRERAAGFKMWIDDLQTEPLLMGMVLLNDRVVTYAAPYTGATFPGKPPAAESGDTQALASLRSVKWEVQASLSGTHDLGAVPLISFRNRARMGKAGISEFDRILPVQKRINKTLLDRLVMQEFSAFKQKWATGMEVERDDDGNAKAPIETALNRLLISPDPDTKFGQFEADDLGPLLNAVAEDIKHAAALVPTPPHYLLGDLVNLSAEALKAAQAALVSRVRMHMAHREEGLEETVRLAMRAAGKTAPSFASMSTRWRNPEFRTEGELVDALVKMGSLGVPREALWERWGASPDEIAEWSKQVTAAAMQQQATAGLFGPSPALPAAPAAPLALPPGA